MFFRSKNKTLNFESNSIIHNSFNDEKVFFQINIGDRIARLWNKKFRRKAYYSDLRQTLENQVERNLAAQKDNRKYIPNVFFELNDIKENLRYVVDPILFFQKIIIKINLIDFTFFNGIFEKLNLEPIKLELPNHFYDSFQLENLAIKTDELHSFLKNIESELPEFDRAKEFNPPLDEEQEKVFIKDEITPKRIKWTLDDFYNDLDTISKRVVLLTERAGQGKTNLVCDFAEKFIQKKSLIGIFLNGNKFHNLTNETIENIILKEIFGFDLNITFKEFLDDIENLCNESNGTFTIIIDGINENSGIANFSKELCDFVEKIVTYNFIRVILTCRSEYFKERFKEFISPPFKKQLLLSENYLNRFRSRDKLPEYIESRLVNNYFKYFQVRNTVFKNVKQILANDFLLLRIFCEFYGKKTNPDAPVEQIYDIYKDDLFSSYFQYKSNLIDKNNNFTLSDYKELFKKIFDYMFENKTFINISFEEIQGVNSELLNTIIDEDIFFRRDLIKTENTLFGKNEVLNFTFDEFRDHLFSDYLINSDHDLSSFLAGIDENNLALEGIEKFIFFKSRKFQYRDKLSFIEDYEHFEHIFISNIFSVNDSHITKDDIDKIKQLFFSDSHYADTIIEFLMYRHRTKLYENLNIFVLFEIICSLDDSKYRQTVNAKFQVNRSYSSRQQSGLILDIIEQAKEILEKYDFEENYEYYNVFEFLILLLGVNSDGYGKASYSLIDLLEDYIKKYSQIAQKQLIKYYNISVIKVRIQIWNLLRYCIDLAHVFEKPFYLEAFNQYKASSSNKNLEYAISNFLVRTLNKNPDLFNTEQQADIKSAQKVSVIFNIPFEE